MNDKLTELIPSAMKVIPVVDIASYVEAEQNLTFLESQAIVFDGLENDELIHDAYEKQKRVIETYMNSIPNFDSTILYNNINYLLKKNNMKIGALEAILGISTGYIAKTIKPGSSKNVSIDVIWKIAKLFNMDVRTLIEKDLAAPASDYQLLMDMIEKLIQKTASKSMHWDIAAEAGKDYYQEVARYIIDEECGVPALLDSPVIKSKTVIEGKVYSAEFTADKDIILVAYADGPNDIHYELYFASYSAMECQYFPEFVFNTTQEETGELEIKTDTLYKCIAEHDNDLHVSETAKNSIKGFLEDLPF